MSDTINTPQTAKLGIYTVNRIGFGAMQLERHHQDRSKAIAVLRRAIELGVNHIDTADFYGNEFVNDVIREVVRTEDPVLISTKVGATPNPQGPLPLRPAQRPEQLRATVEDNLRSLGLEQLPVVNLRRLDVGPGLTAEGDQVVSIEDQLDVMIAMRDEGKIGAIGLSAVTLDGLKRALPAGIVCVQNAYSLVNRRDQDMLELCQTEGIAWVPFFPLGGSFPGLPKVTEQPLVIEIAEHLNFTPTQVGLAWLLGHSPNLLLIPGTSSIKHLEENMALAQIHLDAVSMQALDQMPMPKTGEIKWMPD